LLQFKSAPREALNSVAKDHFNKLELNLLLNDLLTDLVLFKAVGQLESFPLHQGVN